MSVVDIAVVPRQREAPVHEIRIALLGCGQIGSEVARLLNGRRGPFPAPVRVVGALVRTPRPSEAGFPFIQDATALLEAGADILVEVLGGIEPARTLVLTALQRGIPVVTANKRLLAAHGDELFAAAEAAGVSIHYEASVLAGVPFLGTFRARPLAADVDRIVAIPNGTSNFVLSRLDEGATFDDAVLEAQRRGFAESDPSRDLDGLDAADKLAVIVRTVWGWSVGPEEVPTTGVTGLDREELTAARQLGGRIKPVAVADRRQDGGSLFVGPAFLPADDVLASLDGVLNGIRLEREHDPPLVFTGPGAGPAATARSVVDDVFEIASGRAAPHRRLHRRPRICSAPSGEWYLSLTGILPDVADLADLLGSYGVWTRCWGRRRAHSSGARHAALVLPCSRQAIAGAVEALRAITGCAARVLPIVEAGRG